MASIPSSPIFLISLLIFTAVSPPAHGAMTSPQGLTVSGGLCCTPSGNCPGKGVPGVNVTLSCPILGASAVVGQNTTGVNGTFSITVPRVTGLVLGLPVVPCIISVGLPLNSTVCQVLSTVNGTLASALTSVGMAISPVLGLLQNATIAGFVGVNL